MPTVNIRACLSVVLLVSVLAADNNMYDLTYSLNGTMPLLPNTSYSLTNFTVMPNNVTVKMENLTANTAVGTHVQAPCRYQAATWCITDIPFNNLIGPVVVMTINVSADVPINMAMLSNWEKLNKAIPAKSIVLIKTTWGAYWPNATAYLGTNATVNVTNMHFPGLSIDTVSYLVSKNILGVGIDTMSVDYGQSNGTFPVHTALAKANIYTILNVNLNAVNEQNTVNKTAYVMPMKMSGAGAAACRIFITPKNAAYGLLAKPALLLMGICLAVFSYLRH